MIGVRLIGRFGNQLFQYAFAMHTAKQLHTGFYLKGNKYFKMCLHRYFELPSYSALKNWARKLGKGGAATVEFPPTAPYEENKKKFGRDNCIYSGYYQSEKYFKDSWPAIKKEFRIKEKCKLNVREYLKISNDKPLLVMHVRRTDYVTQGDASLGGADISLPSQYYDACLWKVDKLEDYNIVFVTDEPAHVKKMYSHLKPIVSSSADLIVDFQVLMAADVLVLANSSYSWWGAYLNEKNARVLAPKYWYGFRVKKDYPPDVIPDHWEKIEFSVS